MKFKDALAHYKAGIATEEEAAYVEEELEKTQLIAEYLDEDWVEPTAQDLMTPEYQTVRKTLRKHRLLTALLPVAIVAAIVIVSFCVLLPALEAQYYDPTEVTFSEFSTDFDVYLTAYTELFHPGYSYYGTIKTKTGFARYQLDLMRYGFNSGEIEYASASLDHGTLTLPLDFLHSALPLNLIERASYPVYSMTEEHKARVREQLSALPDYVSVTAAISFPEDLTMEELLSFAQDMEGHFLWAGIRNAPEDNQLYPLCGFAPHLSGIILDGVNETYPAFELASTAMTAENLEQHVESLLQYLNDQQDFPLQDNTGMVDPSYYSNVLSYIRKAGVKTYGGVISTTPQYLLNLQEFGFVTQVWPIEVEFQF